MTTLDALYGALFRPRETFLAGPAPLRAGGACVLALSFAFACLWADGDGALLGLALFTALLALGLGWLLTAAALFLTSRALYRRGEFGAIAAGLGLSLAPYLLAAPLAVVARLGDTGAHVAAVGDVLLLFWTLRLALLSLRGSAELNGGQALWVLVVAEAITVALPTAGMLLFGLMLTLALAQAV